MMRIKTIIFKLFLFATFFLILNNAVHACTPGADCSSDYPETCGDGGVHTCHNIKHVISCNQDGSQTCSNWDPGSSCSGCVVPGTSPTPVPGLIACDLDNGGPGYCSRVGDFAHGGGYCNPYCNVGWYEGSGPGCQTVHCSCNNSTTCCPMNPATPQPTNTPVQTTPGQPTNTSVPLRETPPPLTPTNTPIPTNTPTPTPLPTNTPTPVPTKGWNAVSGVPTNAPRQERQVGSTAYTWICLRADRTQQSGTGQVFLSGDGFPTGKNIYVVGCIQVSSGFNCTTGNANLDSQLGIQKDAGHEFSSEANPIVLSSSNHLSTTVISKSTSVTNHVFYGVFQGTGAEVTGDSSSLQYGTFNFAQDYKKCVTIRWDPYGRVFDAKSLEPIPNVKVSILDETRQLVSLPGLMNPATTQANGFYNFFVETGRYFLQPETPKGYTFAENPPLNANYVRAYSNLYKPGEGIDEKSGSPEHRDIPLDPGNNAPRRSNPVSISFSALPAAYASQTKLIGQVSHPLTIVGFYQGNKKIGETMADRFGFYEMMVDNGTIEPYLPIVPYFTKVDLTKNDKSVLGAQTSLTNPLARFFELVKQIFSNPSSNVLSASSHGPMVSPIPRYLEGYTLGKNNEILRNAEVKVILRMSGKTFSHTVSDSYGLVKIYPEDLPVFEYYLEITPVNSLMSYKIETGEFLRQNKGYLEQYNINAMTATKNGVSLQ